MRRLLRTKILVIATVLIALAVPIGRLTYIRLVLTPDYQSVRLADGSVVELLGYSFGKQHDLRIRKPVRSLRDLSDLFKPAPIVQTAVTDRDSLVLWLRLPYHLVLRPGYLPYFLGDVKDCAGYYYPSDIYTEPKYFDGSKYEIMEFAPGATSPPTHYTEEIVAVLVDCYPQRQSRFAVDIFQVGGTEPMATFQIANPNPGRPAPFTAGPIPSTRWQQDLEVTLTSITPLPKRMVHLLSGAYEAWYGKGEPKAGDLQPGLEGRQKVTLSYNYRGKPDENWKISELYAFDAMGNRTEALAAAPSWPCRKYTPPSRGEPYKLTIGVVKTMNGRFDTDELWTVGDIPLPVNGKPIPISGEFKRNDLHLQLISVYGMNGKNFNKDLTVVKIKIDTPLANPVLLLHVEDEHGRTVASPALELNHIDGTGNTYLERGNLDVYHTGWYGDNDTKYRSVPLKIPNGVKHIKLFFKLPRTHFFEFTVPAYRQD